MGRGPEHRARLSEEQDREQEGPRASAPRGPGLTCSLGGVTPATSCGLPPAPPTLCPPWAPRPPPIGALPPPRCLLSREGTRQVWRFACAFGREMRPPEGRVCRSRLRGPLVVLPLCGPPQPRRPEPFLPPQETRPRPSGESAVPAGGGGREPGRDVLD